MLLQIFAGDCLFHREHLPRRTYTHKLKMISIQHFFAIFMQLYFVDFVHSLFD